MSGKVYIASMNMRGEWAKLPLNSKRVNVTSAQKKDSPYRLAFSPMTEIEGGYKGYFCFENYWQSGKRFEELDSKIIVDWWKSLKCGKRRCPLSKGKRVTHAEFNGIDGKLQYIESRKLVYIPEYFQLIKDSKVLKQLKKELKNGNDITIFDFDGVRRKDGSPDVKEVSLSLLKEKVEDDAFPFGHGYIVAASLLGLEPKDYIKSKIKDYSNMDDVRELAVEVIGEEFQSIKGVQIKEIILFLWNKYFGETLDEETFVVVASPRKYGKTALVHWRVKGEKPIIGVIIAPRILKTLHHDDSMLDTLLLILDTVTFSMRALNSDQTLEEVIEELDLEVDRITDEVVLSREVGGPEDKYFGYKWWKDSCYIDSLLACILLTGNSFWRKGLMKSPISEEIKGVCPGGDFKTVEDFKEARKTLRKYLREDYAKLTKRSEDNKCTNVRGLLSKCLPTMKERGEWVRFNVADLYSSLADLFPDIKIDFPGIRMERETSKVDDSKIEVQRLALKNMSDFFQEDGNYPRIDVLWEKIESDGIVFYNGGWGDVDVLNEGLEKAFGPYIIDFKYELVGVVVLENVTPRTPEGLHYTCYFKSKTDCWYHYDDMSGVKEINQLPVEGVWRQEGGRMPAMYFYSKRE